MSIVTRENLRCLKGHEVVTVVKFNLNGSKIISGSEDGNIIVWDWQDNEAPSLTFRGHTSGIKDIALNVDESALFSVSSDGTLKIWGMTAWVLWSTFAHDFGVDYVTVNPRRALSQLADATAVYAS